MKTKGVVVYTGLAFILFAPASPSAFYAQVPETDRHDIDRIVGANKTYIADEGVYNFVFPQEAATVSIRLPDRANHTGFKYLGGIQPCKTPRSFLDRRVSAAR